MRRLCVLATLVGCLRAADVPCEFGVCPAGTACDEVHALCVDPDQLVVCGALASGEPCTSRTVAAGYCDQGVCRAADCGDGYRRDGEACDGDELGAFQLCSDLGRYYDPVPLTCNTECNHDETVCAGAGYCGDGEVRRGIELCDGAPPTQTCTDLGFDAGFLDCKACGPDVDACKQFGWNPPRIAPRLMRDLHAHDDDHVVAVGPGTTVVRFDGIGWQQDVLPCVPAGSPIDFAAVWSLGPADTFAVGIGGVARFGSAGCTRWLDNALLHDVWAASATSAYAIGLAGVYRFDGTTWTLQASGLPQQGAGVIWGNGGEVWAAKGGQLSRFDGAIWKPFTLPNVTLVRAIWGSAIDDVYVGGEGGGSSHVWRFDGTDWTELHQFIGQLASGGVADGRVFVGASIVGATAVLAFDGSSWLELQVPRSEYAFGGLTVLPSGKIYGVTDGGLHILSYEGSVLITDPAQLDQRGGARVAARSSSEAYLLAIDSTGIILANYLYEWDGAGWYVDATISDPKAISIVPKSGTLFAVSSQGLQSRTASTSWTMLDDTLTSGQRVWAAADDDVWIYRTTPKPELVHWNGSAVSTCATCSAPDAVEAMWIASPSSIYAVGGEIVRHYDGNAWSVVSSGTGSSLLAVWGSADDDVYAVGADGTVLHFDGASWQQEKLGVDAELTAVWGTGRDDVFVGGQAGALFHRDRMARWAPVGTGAFRSITSIDGSGDVMFFVDGSSDVRRLVRTSPW